MSAKLLRDMSRRGGAVLWLLLVAGLLAIPAVSGNVRQLDTDAPDPIYQRSLARALLTSRAAAHAPGQAAPG